MIGYFHPHPYPWVLMRGISKEGHRMELDHIFKQRRPDGAYLRWIDLDTGQRSINTNLNGRHFYRHPTAWCCLDVIWWQMPTMERVLFYAGKQP